MTGTRPGPPWSDRAWRWYLAGGAGLIALYHLLPSSGPSLAVRLAAYLAISASAAVAVLVGQRTHAPTVRAPWLLFAAAQGVYAIADTAFYLSHILLDEVTFPGVWDLVYLCHYPVLMAGILLLTRRRGPAGGVAGVLDGLMIAVAGALISWFYLVSPRLEGEQSLLVGLASVAYPVMDLALVGVGLRLVFDGGRRPAAFYLLAAYLCAILAADSMYVLQQMEDTYQAGNYLDAVWLTGNLLLGVTALHPSMGRLTAHGARNDRILSAPRLLALTAAALVAPSVLMVQSLRGETDGLAVVAAASAAMFMLIIFRMAGLVADQRRLAITDGLTGLYTRRHLEAEMAAAVDRVRRDGSRLGLFLVDVDHFKSINDRFGHPAGDRVLVEVARRLRAATRPGDVLARYGGEEFAVLVTDLREADLEAIAQRLRRQVGDEPVRIPAPPGPPPQGPPPDGGRSIGARSIPVTVSVGAAAEPTHASGLFDLVAAADHALYAAKAAGRDRVVVSGSTPNGPDPAAARGEADVPSAATSTAGPPTTAGPPSTGSLNNGSLNNGPLVAGPCGTSGGSPRLSATMTEQPM